MNNDSDPRERHFHLGMYYCFMVIVSWALTRLENGRLNDLQVVAMTLLTVVLTGIELYHFIKYYFS